MYSYLQCLFQAGFQENGEECPFFSFCSSYFSSLQLFRQLGLNLVWIYLSIQFIIYLHSNTFETNYQEKTTLDLSYCRRDKLALTRANNYKIQSLKMNRFRVCLINELTFLLFQTVHNIGIIHSSSILNLNVATKLGIMSVFGPRKGHISFMVICQLFASVQEIGSWIEYCYNAQAKNLGKTKPPTHTLPLPIWAKPPTEV